MEWILNGFWVKPREQQDEWRVTAEKVQIDKGRRRRGKEEEMKKNDYWWRKSQFPWPARTQAACGFLEDNATFETKEKEGGLIYQFTLLTLSGRQQCTQSVLIQPTWYQTCFALIFVCVQIHLLCTWSKKGCLNNTGVSAASHGESCRYLQPGCEFYCLLWWIT